MPSPRFVLRWSKNFTSDTAVRTAPVTPIDIGKMHSWTRVEGSPPKPKKLTPNQTGVCNQTTKANHCVFDLCSSAIVHPYYPSSLERPAKEKPEGRSLAIPCFNIQSLMTALSALLCSRWLRRMVLTMCFLCNGLKERSCQHKLLPKTKNARRLVKTSTTNR